MDRKHLVLMMLLKLLMLLMLLLLMLMIVLLGLEVMLLLLHQLHQPRIKLTSWVSIPTKEPHQHQKHYLHHHQ